jgi:hypothetical protein
MGTTTYVTYVPALVSLLLDFWSMKTGNIKLFLVRFLLVSIYLFILLLFSFFLVAISVKKITTLAAIIGLFAMIAP